MALTLHAPKGDNQLSKYYKRAFANCVELVIVSAYLTEWDESLVLNPAWMLQSSAESDGDVAGSGPHQIWHQMMLLLLMPNLVVETIRADNRNFG